MLSKLFFFQIGISGEKARLSATLILVKTQAIRTEEENGRGGILFQMSDFDKGVESAGKFALVRVLGSFLSKILVLSYPSLLRWEGTHQASRDLSLLRAS